MKKQIMKISVVVVSSFLLSCDGGPKGSGVDPEIERVNHLLTEFESGKIYYDTNCAACHSAGTVDPTSAFGASDLTLIDTLKITNDMTQNNPKPNNYGGEHKLMERFNNVPYDRYHQLRRYLDNID